LSLLVYDGQFNTEIVNKQQPYQWIFKPHTDGSILNLERHARTKEIKFKPPVSPYQVHLYNVVYVELVKVEIGCSLLIVAC
jgi:hypothetical protein